jgi:hypothetical protein
MDLVNLQTQQTEQVPDEHAQQAITSGRYTFPTGAKVPMRTELGGLKELPADEAMAHLVKGTGTIASSGEVGQHAHETPGSYAAAGVEGLARGATAGLIDPAAIAAARALGGEGAGEAVRQHLEEQRTYHPTLSTAAEIAGAVGASALTGGASDEAEASSLAARGLRAITAPARALAGAGRAVEGAVAGALPEAESLAGRLAAKVVSGGAGAALEGAGWAEGQLLDEHALNGGNQALTAEQMLAAAGHGALLGGMVGGAAHGLLGGAGELLERGAGSEPAERMTGFLRREADKLGFRSLGWGEELEAQAGELGGPAAIGRTLHEERIFGDTVGSSAVAPAELEQRIAARKEILEQRIGELVERSPATMTAGQVTKPLDDIIASKIASDDVAAVEPLQAYRDHVLERLHASPEDLEKEIPIRDVFRQRVQLEAAIDKAPTEIAPELRSFHQQLASAEVNGIEAAGALNGKLLAATTRFAHLELAEKAIAAAAARAGNAGTGSVGAWLGGAAGAVVGGALGHGMGAFVGRSIGREAGAKLAGGSSQQVGAYVLDKIHHLAVADRVVQDVSQKIASSLRGYVSRTAEQVTRQRAPVRAARMPMKPLAERFEQRAKEVQAMAQPAAAAERLSSSLGSLATHAPNLSASIASLATADALYLASILPPTTKNPSLLQPQLKGQPPSDSAMHKFMRLSTLLEKPLLALDKLKDGTLLQDEADMLRQRRPELMTQIQESAMKAISNRPTELLYAKRRNLGLLLGIPFDRSMEPEFVATMQASYRGKDEAPPKMRSNAKLDQAHETEIDRIEQGDH